MDGLQRLSTLDRFLNNEFKLVFPKSEEVPPHPLEGKRFNDLEVKLQERIEDTQLTLYILDSKAPERAKLDIFERVNSGEPLTRQQMRDHRRIAGRQAHARPGGAKSLLRFFR